MTRHRKTSNLEEEKMGKYSAESEELLKLVGGKQNIAAVSHCVTRMRFVLNDPSKADVKGIEQMKVVKGTFIQAGQFQVIIGNTVAEFYQDFTNIAGIEGVSKEAVKQAAKQNQNVLQRMIAALAEIFAPLIPAIITGGLILGFRNCIDSMYLFENGTKTLCDISQFWSGVDSFLWLIGEAVFHMLPVGICWSVTKKMGTTQMLGIVLGLTLVSGQLLNAYSVATTPASEIPFWDFGFFHVNMIGYQAQVLPAILAAFCLVYLERFFKKITPQVISMVVVPFCSLVLAVIAAHFVLGPIGWRIGSAISSVVYAGITGSFKILFGAVFGFIYALLVITGLHHMSNAIDLQLIADYNGTMLWPMIALSNIAQGSAVLAMIYLQRKDAQAQEINIPSCISCYLGVTEPAIFGVNLKHVYPFVCGMVGSAVAAMISVSTQTTANAIGVGGIPGILSIKPEYMGTFAVSMAAAIVIPFILTVIVGRKRVAAEALDHLVEEVQVNPAETVSPSGGEVQPAQERETTTQQASSSQEKALRAYADGQVITLAEVNDGVFSSGMLGEGLAIIPDEGMVYAPADGTATALMQDSKHACGLVMDNGMELILHVGLDTVNMKGDGFSYLVTEGQKVKAGDPLIRFDREKIKKAGYPDTIICVVTAAGKAKNIQMITGMKAKAKETEIIRYQD